MKNLKLVALFVLLGSTLFAQETAPNYLTYRYNMNIINPAYAGVEEDGELNIGFRKESLGLDDDPVTQMLSYSRGLKKNLGIGVSIVNDKSFINKQTDFAIDVSYKLQLGSTSDLYFGMKAGGSAYNIDFNSLASSDPLFAESVSTFSPLIGVGAYLKGERYYLNISTPNLLLSEVQKPVLGSNNTETQGVTEKMHLYMGAGYRFIMSDSWDLTPSVFTRIVTDEETLVDLSAVADFSNKFELGATYRVGTSVIGSFMFKLIGNTYVGYAYESVNSDFSTVASGTHEFLLRFRF